jgi:hypothetical protein
MIFWLRKNLLFFPKHEESLAFLGFRNLIIQISKILINFLNFASINNMKKIILVVLFIICSTSALAYIDPGTGSAIAGSLWPILLAIFSTVVAFLTKIFWKPIKRTFKKIFKK